MTELLAELNTALAAAQGEFPPIPREKQVTVKPKTSAPYTFKYAPLDAILTAVRPALCKHGLSIVQLLEPGAIRTELRHSSGTMIFSTFPLPGQPETPQQLGSLLTYIRRYAIVAILGIATEEDDDGLQAADTKPRRRKKDDDPPPEPPPRSRDELMAILAEQLGRDPADYPLPAGFDNWADWARATSRERYEKTASVDLSDDELAELIGLLDDASIPF